MDAGLKWPMENKMNMHGVAVWIKIKMEEVV
jgi:hypothetical protein